MVSGRLLQVSAAPSCEQTISPLLLTRTGCCSCGSIGSSHTVIEHLRAVFEVHPCVDIDVGTWSRRALFLRSFFVRSSTTTALAAVMHHDRGYEQNQEQEHIPSVDAGAVSRPLSSLRGSGCPPSRTSVQLACLCLSWDRLFQNGHNGQLTLVGHMLNCR